MVKTSAEKNACTPAGFMGERSTAMNETARRKAEKLWDNDRQKRLAILDAAQVARRAEATKTARLRELRLAKEAGARQSRAQTQPARRSRVLAK
jgi:hypothetical protein